MDLRSTRSGRHTRRSRSALTSIPHFFKNGGISSKKPKKRTRTAHPRTDLSGADFYKTLRSDEKTGNMPFIAVCAETNKELSSAMHEAGIADFIAKPFTEATLKKKMTALLGSF